MVRRSIIHALEPFKMPIKTLPNLRDIIDGKVEVSQIRSLAIEDLLTRAPVGLDPAPVRHLVEGRRVMVTGAGGSIGSELCRQIAQLHPASLVLFDRYENSLYAIRTELDDTRLPFGLHPVVGDVTDPRRVNDVLERLRPEIMFHAAAHKHVPLMEENPLRGGQEQRAGDAHSGGGGRRHDVERFILISTDKAVNPTSVMGATEAASPSWLLQRQAVAERHLYVGGPVRQRARQQRQRGADGSWSRSRPAVRSPSRTRTCAAIFMLIPEAVQLVLHAAALAQSGGDLRPRDGRSRSRSWTWRAISSVCRA